MNLKQLLFVLICYSNFSFAQISDKGLLQVQYGFDHHQFAMKKVNESYIDSFVNALNPPEKAENISSGNGWYTRIRYKPTKLFSLGFSASLQKGQTKSSLVFTETNMFGDTIGEYYSTNEFIVKGVTVGFTGSFYFSELFLRNNQLSEKFRIGAEVDLGLTYSKAIIDIRGEKIYNYELFISQSNYLNLGLSAEYDVFSSPIITSFGIRGGFQFYKSGVLKDRLGDDWDVKNQLIELDFSGLYFGAYLQLGK